uniref:N-acetyl-D-glucosamine kinase n=1 Tax=Anopheles coluzzii TaxID=1518534 RepID=A0A8W7P732_ANOCL
MMVVVAKSVARRGPCAKTLSPSGCAIVGRAKGPSTNHWAVGIPGVAERIDAMARAAKAEANLPADQQLTAVGLCLSGAEAEETNRELEAYLHTHYPTVAERYVVASDTVGSIQAVSRLGGMVIIAGTGSNTLLRNPDGSTHGCGGWGHMIGDEGGAWWIARNAIKTAGQSLARSVCALRDKIAPDLLRPGTAGTSLLDIVCVGSVWLSWELLRDGFVAELDRQHFPHDLRLLRLTTTMALGAAYLAADTYKLALPRDYTGNYDVFYTYRVGQANGSNGTAGHDTNGRC